MLMMAGSSGGPPVVWGGKEGDAPIIWLNWALRASVVAVAVEVLDPF